MAKTKNKEQSFEFTINKIYFTVQSNHAILEIEKSYSYDLIKHYKIGDKIKIKLLK